jgi:PAS domain S-box-containing protein
MLSRVFVVVVLLVAYASAYKPVYRIVGNQAFLLATIPCLVAGALLGVRGGLLTVVLTAAIDRRFAIALGIPSDNKSAQILLSLATKVVLTIGAGLIAASQRRLAIINGQIRAEVARRKTSEGLLEQSERKYRILVDSLGEGVALFDERDVCTFANPAFLKTFAKERAMILGADFANLLDERSQAAVLEHLQLPTSETQSYEVSPKGRTDSVFLVTETRMASETLPSHRTGQQTLRVVRDLTFRIEAERKQRELERQLQRGQALQSLAVLAGGVAHDFNNLLSGIVGNAEFALRRVPRSAPLELTQSIEEIREFATEASQLSRQMLAYAGRRSLAVGAVDVNVEVREALRLLHSTVEAQAVLRLQLADSLPNVKADRLQLRQIVTNLVINALEAMAPERGTLTIGTAIEELDEEDFARMRAPDGLTSGSFVVIWVQDTGPGIPEECLDRIFEPFFSTKAPGRGMGLAASVGIVRSHRGWLDVSSALGKGTIFRVLLPLAEVSREHVRRLTPTDLRPPRAGQILLIDDEAAVRVVTNRLLVDLGQRVLTADNGRKGLEIFRQHHSTIDLVLLDLTMPELSGADVLKELRRIRSDVAVVITSGFHPSNASDLLSQPNVIGFLEKPHTTTNLQAIVASMFDS